MCSCLDYGLCFYSSFSLLGRLGILEGPRMGLFGAPFRTILDHIRSPFDFHVLTWVSGEQMGHSGLPFELILRCMCVCFLMIS